MAIEACEWPKLGLPLENADQVQSHLRAIVEYGHQALAVVSGEIEKLTEPSTQDVVLRSKYREFTSKLRNLHHNLVQYVEVVQNHPSCSKERQKAILAELGNCKGETQLNRMDVRKFPRLIDFLWEFKGWLENVTDKLDNIKKQLDVFDKEKSKEFATAQTAELEAHNRLRWVKMAETAASGVGALIGAAVEAVGEAVVIDVLPLASCGRLWSYLVSSEFKEEEHENHEIKSKLDELSEAAAKVRFEYVGECVNIHRPQLLFCDLKSSLEIIFQILEESDRRKMAITL